MRRLMTAVAAIALIGGAAHAQGNGKGGGPGGGHGGGHQAAAQGGGGHPDKAGRAPGGGSMQAMNAPQAGGGNKDRGNAGHGSGGARAEARNAGPAAGGMQAARPQHDGGGSKDRGNAGHAGRDVDHRAVAVDRAHGPGNRAVVVDRGPGHRAAVGDRGRAIDVVRVSNFAAVPSRGVIAGCPPGLAKKHPPCVPPGHVRMPFRGYDRPDFWGLRIDDGRYWYDDGYLVRLGPDGRAGGFIPLLGGALAVGNPWPTYYQPVALPVYYENYYGLGPYDSYRYADDVIYRVDPDTAAITSIAALLTGDDFAVGQPMPLGYDVYNVPYPYRAQYYDTPDALYRYSDGYVYQVDPETRLIAAAIELLAS